LLALLLLGVLLAGGYLLSFVDADDPAPGPGPAATAPAPGTGPAAPDGSAAPTGSTGSTAEGIRTVRPAALPVEARRVLRLIDAGGPFPYGQDGGVFGNVERLLPPQPRGWYREYTVPTPGERDRGARRIVAGRDGARYYTADHYDSFARIAP
jgi:ribonuclease T1